MSQFILVSIFHARFQRSSSAKQIIEKQVVTNLMEVSVPFCNITGWHLDVVSAHIFSVVWWEKEIKAQPSRLVH